ncbi:hypothetical protein NPIL_341951, partial [Nephila pilipes]
RYGQLRSVIKYPSLLWNIRVSSSSKQEGLRFIRCLASVVEPLVDQPTS